MVSQKKDELNIHRENLRKKMLNEDISGEVIMGVRECVRMFVGKCINTFLRKKRKIK